MIILPPLAIAHALRKPRQGFPRRPPWYWRAGRPASVAGPLQQALASADRPGSEWPWLHRLQHDQVRHGTVARTACARRCNPAPVGIHPRRDSTALKRELLQITAPGAGMQCPRCGAVVAAAAAGRGSHEGDDAGRGRTTEAKTRVCESTSEGLIDDTVSRTEKRRTEPALRQENTGKASTRSQR